MRFPTPIVLAAFIFTFLIGLGGPTSQAIAGKRPPLHHVSATACGECHQAIFQQWAGSMHANSTALNDPIHGAMYGALVGDPKQEGAKHKKSGKYPICLQCHAPNAARDGKTKLDAMPAYAEGVNCVACHTISSFKGTSSPEGKPQLGAKAYDFSGSSLQGPHGAFNGSDAVVSPGSGTDEKASNPFPHTGNATLFKGGDFCLGCHDQRKNPNKVPVCATGPELRESGNTVICQSCHMPVTDGFANHAMSGGHDPAMIKRGVILDLKAEKSDGGIAAKVTLTNPLAHNFPTGAPFRNVVLKLTGLDADGKVVWKNFQKNAMKEDKKAVLMLKLVGKDGKPIAPPAATKIGGDSRLKPAEVRVLDYTIDAANVATVRAELFYNLLPPPIIKKFDAKLPPEAKTPVSVGRAEVQL
ncbi:MAG: cytochrome c family protein [Magnetococcales bacterium]|nr:cytochrome c family protein [Magnetococcales bacterium]